MVFVFAVVTTLVTIIVATATIVVVIVLSGLVALMSLRRHPRCRRTDRETRSPNGDETQHAPSRHRSYFPLLPYIEYLTQVEAVGHEW